jgi:hypothetical protein
VKTPDVLQKEFDRIQEQEEQLVAARDVLCRLGGDCKALDFALDQLHAERCKVQRVLSAYEIEYELAKSEAIL